MVIVDAVYDTAIAALRAGGRLSGERGGEGAHRRAAVAGRQAQPRGDRPGPQALIDVFELSPKAKGCKFVMVPETGIGRNYPLSGEKLSLVLTVYRAKDFARCQAHRARHPRVSGQGPLVRHPHQECRACARDSPRTSTWCACWSTRRTPSATAAASTTACPSRCRWAAARWQGNADLREPELALLRQHHAPRHHHPRGQAERGSAVRRLLGRSTASDRRMVGSPSTSRGPCCRASETDGWSALRRTLFSRRHVRHLRRGVRPRSPRTAACGTPDELRRALSYPASGGLAHPLAPPRREVDLLAPRKSCRGSELDS